MSAITLHLEVGLGPDCFSATKVERRLVKADTQHKVLREETLPNDEITLPGAEPPDFYFGHACCQNIKTLGRGSMIWDAASFHDFSQHHTAACQ